MTGVNFATGILKNKVYSIYLGISGLGVISQISSVISLLSYVVPLGFPTGITKLIAQSVSKDRSKLNEIMHTCILVLIIPTICSAAVLFFFADDLSKMLFDEGSYGHYIRILTVFVPFILFYSIIEAFIKGISDISLYIRASIVSSVISFLLIVPIVIIFGVKGAVYGLLINFVIFVFYSTIKIKGLSVISFSIKTFKINKDILRQILRIGFALLFVGALNQIVIIFLKRITIQYFGVEGNGIFQSVFSISLFYFGFIFTTLSSYTFPKISGIETITELNAELNSTMRFIMLIMVPLIMILIVFRMLIILTLYTSDFLVAEPFFKFQFLGDFFKALSWVLGIWLVPRSKLIIFVLLDLLYSFNIIFIYEIFLNYMNYGIVSVSMAYLAAYILHFMVNFFVSKKIIGFRLAGVNIKLFLVSICILFLAAVASYQSAVLGYILFVPLLAAWFFSNVSVAELKEVRNSVTAAVKSRLK